MTAFDGTSTTWRAWPKPFSFRAWWQASMTPTVLALAIARSLLSCCSLSSILTSHADQESWYHGQTMASWWKFRLHTAILFSLHALLVGIYRPVRNAGHDTGISSTSHLSLSHLIRVQSFHFKVRAFYWPSHFKVKTRDGFHSESQSECKIWVLNLRFTKMESKKLNCDPYPLDLLLKSHGRIQAVELSENAI